MNLLTDNVSRNSGEILYDGREILDMGKNYRELLDIVNLSEVADK